MPFGVLQKPGKLALLPGSMIAKEEADSQIDPSKDKQPLSRSSRMVVIHIGIVARIG